MTFDRTDLSNACFRFSRFDEGQAVEVAGCELPKQLAVQKMGLSSQGGFYRGKPINQFDLVAALDPTSSLFQESLTAKMWACLESGQPYERYPIEEGLLADYKAKYIAPAITEKPEPSR